MLSIRTNIWFSRLWETVKTGISTGWDGIKTLFLNYTPLGLIYSNWEGITEWFSQKWEEIKATVSSWVEPFSSLGRDSVDGLLNGINEKWQNLKAKVNELVNMLPEWVKHTLGIQSPSRVFMGLGGNIGEGLAVGIGNQENNVLSKMDAIRSKLVTPIRATAALGVASMATVATASPTFATDLTRLSPHSAGANRQISILFVGKGEGKSASGLKLPEAWIFKNQIQPSSQITKSKATLYKSVEAEWHNATKGNRDVVLLGKDSPKFKITHPFSTLKEAERAAKAKLNEQLNDYLWIAPKHPNKMVNQNCKTPDFNLRLYDSN